MPFFILDGLFLDAKGRLSLWEKKVSKKGKPTINKIKDEHKITIYLDFAS